ncbi:N-acetyl-gamma-glutamyl-phosphate reductase [Candidatus Woesearchaeota archaeon]|nr:N-acetyl-gamma-glutamyl-phosphate reductase [Candidatus Woesearchaeota archaeon]
MKAGIIGASGYTGYELIKILSKHKKVSLEVLNSRIYAGKKVKTLYKEFKNNNLKFKNASLDEINKLDVVFLATPNGKALELVPKLKCKVIDLSADYRFKSSKVYEKVYGFKHNNIKSAYGLPELFKEKIKKSKLVGNPGCYVTASLLVSLPIDKFAKNIIFDCKSGYSGAGSIPSYVNNPKNYNDNIIPYKISNHRHKYEMQQYLKAKVSFTPHVIPTFRGLMSTAHILLKKKISAKKVKDMYKKYYKNSPFVKIVNKIPEIKDVQNTNYCMIGGFEIDENNQLVIVSVIDNLLKGASGQAVQNMNIMFGFEETEGLM